MRASAPGKLFLIGEYAVLEGATAVLSTVPQRAIAEIVDDHGNLLTIRNSDNKSLLFTEGVRDEALLKAVVDSLPEGSLPEHVSMTLDTASFYHRGSKLGLGSSAALTAALIKLICPGEPVSNQLDLAIEAHRRFQGGLGSGADVALSIMDTSISFRMNTAPIALTLPPDLHMLAIWSGASASTTSYVSLVSAWKQANKSLYNRLIEKLSETSSRFVAAAMSNNTDGVLTEINHYDRDLEQLSAESGANFYNQAHQKLRILVESAHCAYKPSGAGGGDFGIAYSADKNELINLAERVTQEGNPAFLLENSHE